jgi:hypothetical protein
MEYVQVEMKGPVKGNAEVQWSRQLHDRHQWCILRTLQSFVEFLCSSILGGTASSPTSGAQRGICPSHPDTNVALEVEWKFWDAAEVNCLLLVNVGVFWWSSCPTLTHRLTVALHRVASCCVMLRRVASCHIMSGTKSADQGLDHSTLYIHAHTPYLVHSALSGGPMAGLNSTQSMLPLLTPLVALGI